MLINFSQFITEQFTEEMMLRLLSYIYIPGAVYFSELIIFIPVPDGSLKETPCWFFFGGEKKRKYGRMSLGGVKYQIHRLMHKFFHGEFPDYFHLHHNCRFPRCVNPWHGEPLSPEDHLSGEENGGAKLTYEQVNQMREEFSNGKYSYRQLSEKYDVCERHVRKIIAFEKWKKGSKNHPKK